MPDSLNVMLTEELRRYIEARTGDGSTYTSADEYVRELIRRDMEDWAIVADIQQGMAEATNREIVDESILDIANES